MEEKVVQSISKEVYKRFPEVKGKKPKVRLQRQTQKGQTQKLSMYLLTYNMAVRTSTNKSLPRLVRVVADEQGKIIKISTSR